MPRRFSFLESTRGMHGSAIFFLNFIQTNKISTHINANPMLPKVIISQIVLSNPNNHALCPPNANSH